jgi:cystathionine beta-synthase
MGVGTGGTITGISRKLKELDPNIKVIGVDPPGSILSPPEKFQSADPGGQVIEGTGYDFHPRVYDKTVVDDWEIGPDKESFIMARRLLAEEGLMCGGSSGQAMYGALEYIKKNKIPKGKRVVVVLADNIRNYMTKHLNADWMYERGYINEQQCSDTYVTNLIPNKDWGQDMSVGNLPLHKAEFMSVSATCQEALDRIRETGFEQFPVRD